ncbi:hypothetical protein E2C01_006492 [Portunus trituberculatus]|uniref:Uncharacterized protein n=1 Tax=Portunus trituberculatus TaxID=210409 RepID=A0A5B7CX08_PORTR|nr:hypothetical protein [Portunus trituberculatus]
MCGVRAAGPSSRRSRGAAGRWSRRPAIGKCMVEVTLLDWNQVVAGSRRVCRRKANCVGRMSQLALRSGITESYTPQAHRPRRRNSSPRQRAAQRMPRLSLPLGRSSEENG